MQAKGALGSGGPWVLTLVRLLWFSGCGVGIPTYVVGRDWLGLKREMSWADGWKSCRLARLPIRSPLDQIMVGKVGYWVQGLRKAAAEVMPERVIRAILGAILRSMKGKVLSEF